MQSITVLGFQNPDTARGSARWRYVTFADFVPVGPCQNCPRTFTTARVYLPTHYNEHTDEWTLRGNYCSLACAKRGAIDKRDPFVGQYLVNVDRMGVQLYGRDPSLGLVPAAPPRDFYTTYGGHVDPERPLDFDANYRIHARMCISDAMLMEVQRHRPKDPTAVVSEEERRRQLFAYNIMGLRAPSHVKEMVLRGELGKLPEGGYTAQIENYEDFVRSVRAAREQEEIRIAATYGDQAATSGGATLSTPPLHDGPA
jgi:hypothetical protein